MSLARAVRARVMATAMSRASKRFIGVPLSFALSLSVLFIFVLLLVNLANSYFNDGMIRSLKRAKLNKQVLIVSHNATIPMLGDAQNIILCRNSDYKIKIVSEKLEGEIDGKPVIDPIAEITDGGKKEIKKRFKKYNFKKYREEE